MTTYTVEWTTEIDATSPSEAARAAYQRILAKAHGVTFDVYSDTPDVDGFCSTNVHMDPSGAPRAEVKPLGWQAQLDAVVAEIDAEASL